MARSRTPFACWLALAASLSGCAHEVRRVAPAGANALPTAQPRRFASPYAYEWFIRAELSRAHGEHTAALQGYRMALSSADEDPYVLSRFATLLAERGERAAAEHALDDALTRDPQSEIAWLARAAIAARHGELSAAVLAYERAETAAPASMRAPLALAALLRAAGNEERALAVLERFEARTLPGSAGAARARLALALARHDASAAYAAAQRVWQTHDGARAQLVRTAQSLLEQEQPELAQRVLAALPPRPEEARLRLSVHLASGERAAAELWLEASDPESLGGVIATAAAFLAAGRAERALALAQSTLAIEPLRDEALLTAARARLALGEHAVAAELFARISPRSPLAPAARTGMAAALRGEHLAALAREVSAHSARAAQ